MQDAINIYLPWIISVCTIYMMYSVGNKELRGWVVSGFTQFLWLIYILSSSAWGLLPLNAAMLHDFSQLLQMEK